MKRINKRIGARLRKMRESHGVGQRELERLVDLRDRLVFDIEAGRIELSLITANKLAQFFQCEISDFVSGVK